MGLINKSYLLTLKSAGATEWDIKTRQSNANKRPRTFAEVQIFTELSDAVMALITTRLEVAAPSDLDADSGPIFSVSQVVS